MVFGTLLTRTHTEITLFVLKCIWFETQQSVSPPVGGGVIKFELVNCGNAEFTRLPDALASCGFEVRR